MKKSTISQDDFDQKLVEILSGMTGASLLDIEGVYEAVSEAMNNDVIDAIRNGNVEHLEDEVYRLKNSLKIVDKENDRFRDFIMWQKNKFNEQLENIQVCGIVPLSLVRSLFEEDLSFEAYCRTHPKCPLQEKTSISKDS